MTDSTIPSGPGRRKGVLSVLVVEADPDQLQRIRACLAAPGREPVEIDVAATVGEAREAIRHRKYNCVLIDHDLPRGSGLDLLEQLDEELLTTPVIGLSAEEDPSIALDYFRAGCVDFFIKGQVLDADKLRRGIAAALAKFHRRAMGTVIERRQLGNAVVKSQEGLIALARMDRVMGICNRAVFDEYFETQHGEAVGRHGHYAACMIDVDHFKRYNDRYGHAAGDDVLRSVAQALSVTLRENDFIARYGGEEIVVLLDEVNAESVRGVAERLCRQVHEQNIPHEGNEPHGRITVSLGAAVFGDDTTESAQQVLARADEALYAAKAAGRNTVVVASPDPPDQRMSA